MVKEIVRDPIFLSRKAKPATAEDLETAQDLLDTLRAHRDGCVGMAANMIGSSKAVIVFVDGDRDRVLFNPELLKTEEPFEAEEGCLSLPGTRKTKRYRKIRVRYQNEQFQTRIQTFTGWTAQIIQHEMDHLNGILI